MTNRDSMVMDNPTTFTRNRGIHLSRTSLCLITAIVLCCLCGTAFLVYHFLSCHSHLMRSCELKCSTSHNGDPTISQDSTGNDLKNETEMLDVKLPSSIIPLAYDLKFTPFLQVDNFTFNGVAKIRVKAKMPCKNITLHAVALKIDQEAVQVRDLNANRSIVILRQYTIEEKQFYVIELEDELMADHEYEVHMTFVGLLNEHLQGFYRSSYNVGNKTKWIANTQFQPTDARQAFPCFDEPAFKAKFNISIARPKEMITLSNMRIISNSTLVDNVPGYVWDIYEESVTMSTYLVAFVVCDFDFLQSRDSPTEFKVWARKGAIQSAKYALSIGPHILEFFEDFFQIKYPLPKVEMIALPDFTAGAMENFGLITYRETAMLFDEGISAISNKQRVATVVAHELAHQWFGNMVTPTWWTDLWLNEGFASYMEYLGVDAVEPSWHVMDQFVVEELQNVFALDALSSSHPVSITVNHPEEINEIFDRISYGKGATIIRMMDHFLTSKVFRSGLTTYLRANAFDSAEQDVLWKFLTEAGHSNGTLPKDTTVKEIMDTWTLQKGFPVLNVNRNYDSNAIEFTQDKFNLIPRNVNGSSNTSNEEDRSLWWIPVTYTHTESLNFNDTRPQFWIKKEEMLTRTDIALPKTAAILINVQQSGYYRVNYDTKNWNRIIGHLMNPKKFSEIAPANRAQLLDDAMNLARAGLLDYRIALNVTRYLKHETDFVPMKAGINVLNFVDRMLVRMGKYNHFKEYYLSLIQKAYNRVGFDDPINSSLLTVYKRIELLTTGCYLGLRDCIDQCTQRFNTWYHEANPDFNNPISPNLKDVVYCTAIKYSDQTFWDFAWDRYQRATVPSEKEILLSAMGCSREPWILNRYLEWAISGKNGIRKQDVFRVFSTVSNNAIGQPLAFNFIRNNWQRLKDYMGTSIGQLSSIVKYTTTRMNTQFDLDELKRFEAVHGADMGRSIKQAVEQAEANVHWMNTNHDSIIEWLESVGH